MTRLTPADEDILTEADAFQLRYDIADLREDAGETGTGTAVTIAALVIQLGKARHLIGEMTAMVRRMDKDCDDE
jgi:hypothetical protein